MINVIPFIILTSVFWASVNYVDKYLIEKVVNKKIGSLVIFSGLIGFPTALLIKLFFPEVLTEISITQALVALVAGIIFLVSLVPYFKALEKESATTVSPMFILIPIFAGILSWVILQEHLKQTEIIGSAIILSGVYLLALSGLSKKRRKFNLASRVLGLMIVASFLQALVTIMFKAVALEESFWAAVFWESIGLGIAGSAFLIFNKKYRRDFFRITKGKKISIIILNINNEVANMAGNVCFRMSFVLIPIALAEVLVEATQPVIVLVLGILINKFIPTISTEKLDFKTIQKKLKVYLVIIVGIIISGI